MRNAKCKVQNSKWGMINTEMRITESHEISREMYIWFLLFYDICKHFLMIFWTLVIKKQTHSDVDARAPV